MKLALNNNINILFYFGLVLFIFFCAFILLIISMSSKIGLKSYWGKLTLFNYKEFFFFISKTAAYRRILYYFTFISYGLRILSVLTTFFIIYSLVDSSSFSSALLILAALCDGINLLFPFQKYVDLFSECCIKMEECILESNSKLLAEEQNKDLDIINYNITVTIYNNLRETYVECENLIHTKNKI